MANVITEGKRTPSFAIGQRGCREIAEAACLFMTHPLFRYHLLCFPCFGVLLSALFIYARRHSTWGFLSYSKISFECVAHSIACRIPNNTHCLMTVSFTTLPGWPASRLFRCSSFVFAVDGKNGVQCALFPICFAADTTVCCAFRK